MKLRNALLASTCIAIVACAGKRPTAADCGPAPTQQQVTASVQAYIANVNWKDPDSVKVRNVQLQECRLVPKGLLVGGPREIGWEIDFEINAKNSYGGYTGFQLKSITRTPDGNIHWDVTQ